MFGIWKKYEGDELFRGLCQEVMTMPPGARLSQRWRMKMEKVHPDHRPKIVNNTHVGCTPLFIASKRGLAEVVEYLHVECGADLEQKGLFDVTEDRSVHFVTPLWCAAVADKVEVVRVLVKLGANLDTVSDTGSTPVRSACFMTNFDVVQCLVNNGADIMRPNFNGGTCLINSVQNAALCEFLIDNGADVNAKDIKFKTALHYAIEEMRLDTVQLLMERGADPYIKSRLNDDALQTACCKGAVEIFLYLSRRLQISSEERANAHELLGATYLDEISDINETISHWKLANLIRSTSNIKKQVAPPLKAFGYCQEFTSDEELYQVLYDHDSIRMQSLLICLRILGPTHKDTIFRIMYRGAAYADTLQYQKCIQLWLYAFHLRIRKDTILYIDACNTAHALAKLFLDLLDKFSKSEVENFITFEDAFEAIRLIGDEIEESQKLLTIRPIHNRQQQHFNNMLVILLHFLYVILQLNLAEEESECLQKYFQWLLGLNPRTTIKKETLLHLSVSRSLLMCPSNDQSPSCPFPNHKVAAFLLKCGARVNARNVEGVAPLYQASFCRNYSKKIFTLLMESGAHLDQATLGGDTALHVLQTYKRDPDQDVVLPVLPLKCLAARAVKTSKIPLKKGSIPVLCEDFIRFH